MFTGTANGAGYIWVCFQFPDAPLKNYDRQVFYLLFHPEFSSNDSSGYMMTGASSPLKFRSGFMRHSIS